MFRKLPDVIPPHRLDAAWDRLRIANGDPMKVNWGDSRGPDYQSPGICVGMVGSRGRVVEEPPTDLEQ